MEHTKEEILEGNRILAEFMELKVITMTGSTGKVSKHYAALPEPLILIPVGRESLLHYHKSWDWLMPVIDKINAMGKEYSLAIFKTYVSLTVEKGGKVFKDFSFAYSEYITVNQTGKEAAFRLLTRFITWHNESISPKNLVDSK